jgi:RNA-directed DNA polymerase
MSNQLFEKEVVLMLTDTTIRRLEALGALSKQGKRINGLFRLMESPILWQQAYANIYANKGATTPGADGSSLDSTSNQRFVRLMAAIKSGTYRFTPVRRVHIPKSNGKTRPLGIPTGDDKLVQEVVRMLLAKVYEDVFSNDSHGFRNGRSCHTALMQVRQKWTGMKWIVNMDIKGFFDNIDHEVMIEVLAKRIDDERFLALIRSMLKAGYLENWRFHETFSGTPQGGVVSPILANI